MVYGVKLGEKRTEMNDALLRYTERKLYRKERLGINGYQHHTRLTIRDLYSVRVPFISQSQPTIHLTLI